MCQAQELIDGHTGKQFGHLFLTQILVQMMFQSTCLQIEFFLGVAPNN